MFEDETPIAWTAMPKHTPVVGTGGSEIGVAETVIADPNEDIVHGLVLRRGDGARVEVPAARIKKMTERHVVTDLAEDEVDKLAPYSSS